MLSQIETWLRGLFLFIDLHFGYFELVEIVQTISRYRDLIDHVSIEHDEHGNVQVCYLVHIYWDASEYREGFILSSTFLFFNLTLYCDHHFNRPSETIQCSVTP